MMGEPNSVLTIARTLCKSGRFETGEGTCSLLCMDQLGDARRNCSHVIAVHGKLATQINDALNVNADAQREEFERLSWATGPTGPVPDYMRLVGRDVYARQADLDAEEAIWRDLQPYGLSSSARWYIVGGTVAALLVLYFVPKLFLGA